MADSEKPGFLGRKKDDMTTSIIREPVRRRISGSLFAGQSLFSAATILSFTLTAIIAADLSGSDSAAGLPTTVSLVARAALAYPVGWILDRFGRRLGLSAGFLVGLFGSLLGAWSIINGSFLGFLASAALLGGSRASSEQSRYVAAEVYPSSNRSRVIGWIVFAGTIGAIGGPLLVEPAINMAEIAGIAAFAGPFLASGLLLLVAAVVIFLMLRPDPQRIGKKIAAVEREQVDGEPAAEAPARPLRQIFAGALPLLAVVAMMIGQLVMTMLMVITSLHMIRNDHDTGAISLVIMAHTLGMFGLSGLTGWLVGRLGRVPMIIAGSIVLLVACLLAPLSTELSLLALALFLLGLGWNFAFVAGSSLLSDQLVPAERGRAQGAGEMAVAIGAGLGGLSSGIIFDSGGIEAVSLAGLGFSLDLLVITCWVALVRRPVAAAAASPD